MRRCQDRGHDVLDGLFGGMGANANRVMVCLLGFFLIPSIPPALSRYIYDDPAVSVPTNESLLFCLGGVSRGCQVSCLLVSGRLGKMMAYL